MYHTLIRNTETGDYYLPLFRQGRFVPGWTPSAAAALHYDRCNDDPRFDTTLQAAQDRALVHLASLGFAVEAVSCP